MRHRGMGFRFVEEPAQHGRHGGEGVETGHARMATGQAYCLLRFGVSLPLSRQKGQRARPV